ncbi:MAG: DUF1648 domain-containing protein [Coriobacteriia bacterium]|nr:DUF1648 domain-containing protein [Coriobacteriia bacterium]
MSSEERARARETSPEATHLVDTYLERVHGALLRAAVSESEETVEEIRDYVEERLSATDGTPQAVSAVLAEFGPPEALAAAMAEGGGLEDASQGYRAHDASGSSPLVGRILGMPYDLRVPTSERIAAAWWNPLDTRIFVPRVFGAGWDVNFGAVAVRLGLVRPDDEDEPFACVPHRVLSAAIAVPGVVAAAFVAFAWRVHASLPASIATHYDIAGTADGFSGKDSVLLWTLGVTLTLLVWNAADHIRRRRPAWRAAGSAAALFAGILAMGMYAQGAATAWGLDGIWIVGPGIVLSIVAPFALLVTLARIGRGYEARRDAADKECV